MRPAIMPICSCCEPRVAEIEFDDCTSKLSGRAPYFSWSARVFELSCVNEPEICGLPSRMTPFIEGASITAPSSTKANWFCGLLPACVNAYRRWLTSPKVFAPSASKTTLTTHWPFCVFIPAVASVIDEPSSSTGPRMYFAVPAGSQAITG